MSYKLKKIRDTIALAKFRFDIGISFLTFINFSLLIVAASDKLQRIWNVSTFTLWIVMIPVALIGTWSFGFLLDKVIKYTTSYNKIATERVPQFVELLEIVKDIQKRTKYNG